MAKGFCFVRATGSFKAVAFGDDDMRQGRLRMARTHLVSIMMIITFHPYFDEGFFLGAYDIGYLKGWPLIEGVTEYYVQDQV